MTIELTELQKTAIDALEDKKGLQIVAFDTRKLSDLFDTVIVATGTSNRHTRALASNVADEVKAKGFDVLGSEGEETGDWVLVDMGSLVLHVMLTEVRSHFRLEELWGGKVLFTAQ